MNVLFFSTAFPQPRDPQRSPYNLHRCAALARQHRVGVISPEPWPVRARNRTRPPSLPASLTVRYPVFYYPPGVMRARHEWFLWTSVRREVVRLNEQLAADVVLSYWTYPDGAVALRIADLLGVPAVCIVGGSDVLLANENQAAARRVRGVLERAGAVITVNDDLRTRIIELAPGARRVDVMPSAVDSCFTPGSRSDARTTLGIGDRPTLFWAGRIVGLKNLDVLVDACDRVRGRYPDLQLFIAGEGPDRKPLEAGVHARGLADTVKFLGPVPQAMLPEWYRAADLTVLPSRSEGTPNVLLESIACGTPFVASAVGGIPPLAEPGLDELVAPGAAEPLAAALVRALDRRGSIGQRRVSPGSWAAVGEAIAATLEFAIEERRHEPSRALTA